MSASHSKSGERETPCRVPVREVVESSIRPFKINYDSHEASIKKEVKLLGRKILNKEESYLCALYLFCTSTFIYREHKCSRLYTRLYAIISRQP